VPIARLLHDIAVAVIAATALGLVAHGLRQPPVLGYILAGVLVGPGIGFGLIGSTATIDVISELGLVLLLFLSGLGVNLRSVLSSGPRLLLAAVVQFLLQIVLGWLFFSLLGYPMTGHRPQALYLAMLCAFSSASLTVKLLYDKFELDTMSGRATLGILFVQAFIAMFVFRYFHSLHHSSGASYTVRNLLLLGGAFAVARVALRPLFAAVAKTPDLVVGIAVAWCAVVAGAAGWAGMPKEIGALIAGSSIAAMPFAMHIRAKTTPLRDLFMTLFFVSLGMQVERPAPGLPAAALATAAFIAVSRIVTTMPAMVLAGAGRRTSFIAGLNLSQIGEFALVIAVYNRRMGFIDDGMLSIIVYAMILTIVGSSYAIRESHRVYAVLFRLLGFASDIPPEDVGQVPAKKHPVVVLGYHRAAQALLDRLESINRSLLDTVLIIDFNPESLRTLRRRGVAGMFGDIGSMDTLRAAGIGHAKAILSTIPDMMLKGVTNMRLVQTCRMLAPDAYIAAVADDESQAAHLRNAGATETVLPYDMLGGHFAAIVETVAGRE